MTAPTELEGVWVESDRTAGGTYRATIHPTPDVSIPLDHDAAGAYARAVITVCEWADFDAGVIAQMQAAGLTRDDAAQHVIDMREARRRLPVAETMPLAYTPVISTRDGRPYVHVHLHGEPYCQWTTDEARGHALHVLSVAEVARLDQLYHHHLTHNVMLTPERAAVLVHTLREHRHGNGGLS